MRSRGTSRSTSRSTATADPGSRVERWLRCPEKTCCSYYTVFVTGDDVARVARALAVPPWQFTAALPCEAGEFGAFALGAERLPHRLALVRTQFEGEAQPWCTFLIRATGGNARCGLGALRPAPCRSFPVQLRDGRLEFERAGCVCDWSGLIPDEADRDLLAREEGARATYAGVVARWNDYVAGLPDAGSIAHADFCRYLLDVYAGSGR